MGLPFDSSLDRVRQESTDEVELKTGQESKDSQTATEFIDQQLELESDAREILPYKFDTCTQIFGPLRQNVFACLTCSPTPASPAQVYTPAGICYSCSISCHGEHNLVELFSRRNFTCDCGSTRLPSTSQCTLRSDEETGSIGVHSQRPAKDNHYNQNFQNRFCGCGEEYDAHQEKGTMYQCLGLGTIETGGCGEDWWHPECLMGLSKDWHKSLSQTPVGEALSVPEGDEANNEQAAPPGFPSEEDFEAMICYKCVESYPWIKSYAGTAGFLEPVLRLADGETLTAAAKPAPLENPGGSKPTLKRKASEDSLRDRPSSPAKRTKDEGEASEKEPKTEMSIKSEHSVVHKHDALPAAPNGVFSLFMKEDFRDHLCHCTSCFPNLRQHPQLLEEEETYAPPLSSSAASPPPGSVSARSHGTGSLLERGEAALNTMDRVRAIEGVMVYNHLRDKVKAFLKPYAESGQAVGAEDIKAYFEKLRGDEQGIRDAGKQAEAEAKAGGSGSSGGDGRREQGGY